MPVALPDRYGPWVGTGILMAWVGVVFFFTPAIIVRAWRTQRLGEGELRTRLERLRDRLGMRCRDIRVWQTGGVLVNAGVMGVHNRIRYVLISDGLLEQMDDAQIVAVFGHEAGHAVHHHIVYLLVFAAAMMMLCTALVAGAGWLLGIKPWRRNFARPC